MPYIVIGVIFLAAIIYFVAKKFKWMSQNYNNNPDVQKQKMEEELESLETPDFEKEFFERCEAGEESILFMKVSSQQDCAVLRSLLFSSGVPSYIEAEHSSGLYGNAADVNIGLISMKLYILKDDCEEALEIAKDFIRQKTGGENSLECNGLKIYTE